MSLTIRRHTPEDLYRRHDELSRQLTSAYSSVEGAPISLRDLRDLASMGCLSTEERELYDELRRVEMMLDIDN